MDSAETKSFEEKLQEVTVWLKCIYDPNLVPDYEVHETTVGTLHKIMTNLITNDMEIEEMLKNQKMLTGFYSSESAEFHDFWYFILEWNMFSIKYHGQYSSLLLLTDPLNKSDYLVKSNYYGKCFMEEINLFLQLLGAKKLKEILRSSGISLEDLPEECHSATKALASAACILDLKEPTAPNFLLGLNNLARQHMNISEKRRKQLQLQSKLTKKLNASLRKVETLQREVNAAQETEKSQISEESKRISQTNFLQSKSEEYKTTVKQLEEKLEASGFHPTICHSQLVKNSEEIKKVEGKLNAVMTKLDSYHNLPPNENLAKLKIEEARAELYKLEQELQANIESKTKYL